MLIWITKRLSWEYLDVIFYFAEFVIYHLSRHINNGANILTHQTSGYMIRKGQLHIKGRCLLMPKYALWTNRSNWLMRLVWLGSKTGLTACKPGLTIFSYRKTQSRLWWSKIVMQPRLLFGEKKFPTEKHKVGYRGLAFHIQFYFHDGLCYQNAEEVYDSWI